MAEREKDALKAVVTRRRTNLSGKRKAIGDNSLITTVQKLREVLDAEQNTKERRGKKLKVGGKKSHQVKLPFSEESSTDEDGVKDLEVVMLDSIEVLVRSPSTSSCVTVSDRPLCNSNQGMYGRQSGQCSGSSDSRASGQYYYPPIPNGFGSRRGSRRQRYGNEDWGNSGNQGDY